MRLTTLKVLRQLLVKAINLVDTMIAAEKGEPTECLHEGATELTTMGRGTKRRFVCPCGEQFTQEVQNEIPQTMGRRRPGGTESPGTRTGAQSG